MCFLINIRLAIIAQLSFINRPVTVTMADRKTLIRILVTFCVASLHLDSAHADDWDGIKCYVGKAANFKTCSSCVTVFNDCNFSVLIYGVKLKSDWHRGILSYVFFSVWMIWNSLMFRKSSLWNFKCTKNLHKNNPLRTNGVDSHSMFEFQTNKQSN